MLFIVLGIVFFGFFVLLVVIFISFILINEYIVIWKDIKNLVVLCGNILLWCIKLLKEVCLYFVLNDKKIRIKFIIIIVIIVMILIIEN